MGKTDDWLSVTEIIAFPEKPFLIDWARRLALEGNDHRRVALLGKYAGRIMHYEFLKRFGTEPEKIPNDVAEAYLDPEALDHGAVAWGKLSAWSEGHFRGLHAADPRLFLIEYPIEDEELRVRARLDCVFNNGILYDWKSSRHVYGDAVLELGAYDYLWQRRNPDSPLREWVIVQCSHDDDLPVQLFRFEESEIKRAGLVFASMIPAVRAYKEWEDKTKNVIRASRVESLDF